VRLVRSIVLLVMALAPWRPVLAQGVLGFPAEHLPVQIQSVHSGKCLDVRNAGGDQSVLQQYTCGQQENQTWFLISLGGSEYQLRPGHLGNVRPTITADSLGNGAIARLGNADVPSQVFRFVPAGQGIYEIVSKPSGKCLDVTGASMADGATIQQWQCWSATHQRWRILPRARPLHLVAKHSDKCIDVSGTGAVQQWDCLGSEQDDQEWSVEPAGSEAGVAYWRLKAQHSGLCLDQDWWSGELVQRTCNAGFDSQRWTLTGGADGYVEIQSRFTGWCVDVAGASTAAGAAVRYWPCNGGDNQRFFWARGVRRHVVVMQPATTEGLDRHVADPVEFATIVAGANDVYRRYGIELLYDPAVDTIDEDSDALYLLGDVSKWNNTYECRINPHWTNTPTGCADLQGSSYPGRVVTILGPEANAGFSSGQSPYIFFRATTPQGSDACGTGRPFNVHFAHELGHYFGLSHTSRGFPNAQAAGNAYVSAGQNPSVFDNDLLTDTTPDPGTAGVCLAPTQPTGMAWIQWTFMSPWGWPMVAWTGFIVNTDNIMSPPYFHVSPLITPQQAAIVRATAYARGL
jgi:hypothetical protein